MSIDPKTLPPEVRAVLEAAERLISSDGKDGGRLWGAVDAYRAARTPSRAEGLREWLGDTVHAALKYSEPTGPAVPYYRAVADRLLAGPLKPVTPEELADALACCPSYVAPGSLPTIAAALAERYLIIKLPELP